LVGTNHKQSTSSQSHDIDAYINVFRVLVLVYFIAVVQSFHYFLFLMQCSQGVAVMSFQGDEMSKVWEGFPLP